VTSTVTGTTVEVRPFRVEISDEALEELRRRISASRLPSRELVDDRSQGVQLATVKALARYWATDYDWRKFEAEVNALPQFKTEIDGVCGGMAGGRFAPRDPQLDRQDVGGGGPAGTGSSTARGRSARALRFGRGDRSI
jgi:Epoxide hydrolase N terminus